MARMEQTADRERRPLSFPRWKETLAAAALAQAEKAAHTRAIIAFLGYCKRSHAPASIILIKAYLAGLPEQERSGAREALRWWYRAAQGGGRWAVAGEWWADGGGLRTDARGRKTVSRLSAPRVLRGPA